MNLSKVTCPKGICSSNAPSSPRRELGYSYSRNSRNARKRERLRTLGQVRWLGYDTVFAYGPTPAQAQPHWYEFLFDGRTDATLGLNGFTLTVLDGDAGERSQSQRRQLRLSLAVSLSRVLNGRSPTHDLILPPLHGLEIVVPAALGQAIGKIVNQHPGLIDLQSLGNRGVGPGNERPPVRISLRGIVADGPHAIIGASGWILVDVERVQAVRTF
jgi:hypothetical protein